MIKYDRQFLDEAINIADRIWDEKIPRQENFYWVHSKETSLEPVDWSLYRGRVGISIFFAALYNMTGNHKYKKRALNTIGPIEETIHTQNNNNIINNIGLGGVTGADSISYGLLLVNKLISEEISAAVKLVNGIDENHILEQSNCDIVNGCAGSILCLVPFAQKLNSKNIRDTLESCGDFLLENRSTIDGFQVWSSDEYNKPLAGFSHGQAGIAYALDQLSVIFQNNSYSSAIQEAIKFESQLRTKYNWRDQREKEIIQDETPMDAWCHGRTGIGIARLGMRSAPHENIQDGHNHALEGVFNTELLSYDHLCCGESGRIEYLLLSKEIERAKKKAIEVIKRKQRRGGYSCLSHINHKTYEPGLFPGTAGIGYTLLRLINPKLPSILLWEAP